MPQLPAKIGLQTATSKKALVLPIESVSGSVSHGQVSKLDETGATQRVDVELGITDGALIEISSGLAEGDLVQAIAPGLFGE